MAGEAQAWEIVFEVTGAVGALDGVGVDEAFQITLKRVARDPTVVRIRGTVLHQGVTHYEALGDIPNVTGYRIEVVRHAR